jgi:hypothetical protein
VNTDARWPSLDEARARVLEIQTKLHRWAMTIGPVESRMRWKPHVRFGTRAEETDRR